MDYSTFLEASSLAKQVLLLSLKNKLYCQHRFLSGESEVPYFKMGAKPVGTFTSTAGTIVDSELPCFTPIVEMLQVEVLVHYLGPVDNLSYFLTNIIPCSWFSSENIGSNIRGDRSNGILVINLNTANI